MNTRTLAVVGFFLTALSSAHASLITLSPVVILHQFQQVTNSPCVIGEPSCQNGSFAEGILPPGASSYDFLSPVYTVSDIRGVVGDNFWIGLDVNQTDVSQTLSLFTMSINGAVVDSYSPATPTLIPPP